MRYLVFLFILLSSQVHAQRIIFPEPPHPPRPAPWTPIRGQQMDIASIHASADINTHTAAVTLTQVFRNPHNRVIEGLYMLPIPKGLTINDFRMIIDKKEVPAELLDADKARAIYERIVRKRIDPALLEYQGGQLLKLRIFPIPPKGQKEITIEMKYAVEQDAGFFQFQLPLPEALIEHLTIDLTVNGQKAVANAFCPTHQMDILYANEKTIRATMEEKDVHNDGNFKWMFSQKNGMVEAQWLAYENQSKEQFFSLNLSPGFGNQQLTMPKDISFVLDVSGSMAGNKLKQAKAALSYCLNNLNPQDGFNVIKFSTEAHSLFSERKLANETNIREGLQWVEDLRAVGGTNIHEALSLALKGNASQRPEMVVFITDGRPTIGNTIQEEIIHLAELKGDRNRRIFTFGVGDDLNELLLDKLTEQSGGYRSYVAEKEDIEIKVSDFYRKVASPVLTDLELAFSKNIEVFDVQPKRLPDLFRGSNLSVLGKYSGKGPIQVSLSGKVNGKPKHFTYDMSNHLSENNDFVAKMWAIRQVAFLYDQIRLNGENKEVKDELIKTAKEYGIITPYTSFLIIEDEADLIRQGRIGMEETIWNNRMNQNGVGYSPNESKVASADAQMQRTTNNVGAVKASMKKLDYIDQTGNKRNMATDVKYRNGRAFYLQNNRWTDVQLIDPVLDKNDLKTQQVKYGSEQYIQLMNRNRTFQNYLSLGQNIAFVDDGVLYEIVE